MGNRLLTASRTSQAPKCSYSYRLSIQPATWPKKNQQITVLVSARLRQSRERLKLDELLRDALRARTNAFQQVGVDLHHSLRTVEVVVDVPLLWAALDWTFSMSSNLKVKLGMKAG